MNTIPITIRHAFNRKPAIESRAFKARDLARRARRGGYTLMEVLLAVGIFAIGFAMVATIFPSALLLQKKTVDAINGMQMTRNSEAAMLGRNVQEADIVTEMSVYGTGAGTWDDDGNVYRIPPQILLPDGGTPQLSPMQQWTLRDRSYPTTINTPENRRFFWVPMIKDNDTGIGSHSFILYMFILQKHADRYVKSAAWANPNDVDAVPGVAELTPVTRDTNDWTRINLENQDYDLDGTNDTGLSNEQLLIGPGDKVLDNNGTVYEVLTADTDHIIVSGLVLPPPTSLWFGHPGWDNGSPAEPEVDNTVVDIIQLVEPFN